MPGARDQTQPGKALNASWSPTQTAGTDKFQMMIVADDEDRYTMATTRSSVNAIVALAQAGTVLLWDRTSQTLIAANVVREMP